MPGDCLLLLIDDSPEDCLTVRDLLREGFVFREAHTAAEGLKALGREDFDCVLLDQRLPDATGLELIGEITRLFGAAAPPVILVTGSQGDEIGARAIQAGAQDFMLKDEIGTSVLRRSIRHARERHEIDRARKQAKAELRKSLEKLQLTQQTAGVGHWDWDSQGSALEVSESHLPLYGMAPAKTISLRCWITAVDPRDRLRCWKTMRAAMISGADCEMEFRTVWPDGSIHWIASRGKFVEGQEQGARRLTGLVWDITTLKRTEEDLRLSVHMLTDLNEETRIFAYALAHDLRGPLRSIGVLTQLLSEELGSHAAPGIAGTISHILAGTKRMDNLVQSLGRFMNAGAALEKPAQAVYLGEIVDDCVSNLRAEIEEARAVVRFSELPWVRYHREPVAQLLQNLIENAIKYRRAGIAPEIQVRVVHLEDESHLCVHDNGQGFDAQYADQIFQAFERLHGADHPGSGLGLATCRRIAERFGGRIWADSEPGVGSRFYVSFPNQLVIQSMAANG